MLSRVAENIYWMARYLERAEDTARLISVNTHLLLDLPRSTTLGWSSLVDITGSGELFNEHYSRSDEASVLNFLCADRRYHGSIISSLAAARENLRTTRDVMPREIWEEVNQLYLNINVMVEAGVTPRNIDLLLKRVIRSCETVTGLIEGTLSYTQVRTFLMMGRLLERVDMTTRIIDVRSANLLPRTPEELTPFENLQWMSVLKSLTGFQMYRQHVRLRVRGPDVLRFLLQDRRFPRAIACTLDRLAKELDTLPRHDQAIVELERCRERISQAQVFKLAAEPDLLHHFVDEIQLDIINIHDAIRQSWFAFREDPQAQPVMRQEQS